MIYMSVGQVPPEGTDTVATWRGTGASDLAGPAGAGQMGGAGDVYFALHDTAPATGSCAAVTGIAGWVMLRLDEVAFPVGAVAARHVHTGAGWRYLIRGALRIEIDEGAQVMQPGMSWFEPAHSPVRAVALQDTGETRFVRCMVIPAAFEGRSTFQLCDAKDADLPRLQVTHRHFDHALQVDAG